MHVHLNGSPIRQRRRWRTPGSRATWAIAGLLFVAVLLLRMRDANVNNGEGVLLLVPVGILALRFGVRGGLAGGLIASALLILWGDLGSHVAVGAAGYASRAVAFVTLGVLLGMFVDHRRKLEAEIVRYYNGSLDLLATADLNGHFTRVNPAWTRLLGYSAETMCSKSFIDFVHPDDCRATIAETEALATGAELVGFRNRYRAADGTYRWLEWTASTSLSTGVIYAVARDVTAQQEAEQQLAQNAKGLETMVAERTRELDEARAETLRQLAIAAEYRDDETYQHTERVGITAEAIAARLGLPAAQVRLLRLAAPLHDVGKLAIPDRILLKPGKLTAEEFEIMKTHAALGSSLLSNSSSPVLHMASVIAAHHHERWDGTGYPKGLSGETIPLVGRVVAVADVFDALIHDRPYKTAWSVEDAIAEIKRSCGSQFDPRVVAAFVALQEERERAGERVAQPADHPVAARRRRALLQHVDRHAPRAQPAGAGRPAPGSKY